MSNIHQRKGHSKGFNHRSMERAVKRGDFVELGLAVLDGVGGKAARRSRARGIVDKHLRNGGELTLPTIEVDLATVTGVEDETYIIADMRGSDTSTVRAERVALALEHLDACGITIDTTQMLPTPTSKAMLPVIDMDSMLWKVSKLAGPWKIDEPTA